MSRTVAERAREDNLRRVDNSLFQKFIDERDTELNLSMLPTETSMRMCMLKSKVNVDGSRELYVTDDVDEVSSGLGVKTNEFTLRQVQYAAMAPKNKNRFVLFQEEAGVNVKLSLDRRRQAKQAWPLFLDGESCVFVADTLSSMAAKYGNPFTSIPQGAMNAFLDEIDRLSSSNAFAGQHTIRFPEKFQGRDEVSFLGLPAGTKVPTKSGGMFEVVKRVGVHLPNNNVARGMLAMKAMNKEAANIVAKEGWHVKVIDGNPCALVPDYLRTQSQRHQFIVKDIEVPYKDPTERWRAFFDRHPAGLITTMGVKVDASRSAKMIFYDDKEALSEALDDFLFG